MSLVSIAVYSQPLLRIWCVPRHSMTAAYRVRFIVPLSLGKAIAVTAAYASLWKVPISYAHTG